MIFASFFSIILPLPNLAEPAGQRVLLFRNTRASNKMDQALVFKVSSMIQDIMMMEDDNFLIAGMTGVQDMAEVTMSYALSLSPSIVKKAMTCFQEGYPNRNKGMHFINTNSVFETLNGLFRPFLAEKLQKRVCLCCFELAYNK